LKQQQKYERKQLAKMQKEELKATHTAAKRGKLAERAAIKLKKIAEKKNGLSPLTPSLSATMVPMVAPNDEQGSNFTATSAAVLRGRCR